MAIPEEMKADVRDAITGTVSDLISDFLYYDRKEDPDLPRGLIEDAVREGLITVDEIVETFREELTQGLQGDANA